MENNMYTQAQYKCAICGKIYDNLKERINCESKCLREQEAEALKAAAAKKKEEQMAAHTKVTSMLDDTFEAIMEYTNNYGAYTYNGAHEHKTINDFLRWIDFIML